MVLKRVRARVRAQVLVYRQVLINAPSCSAIPSRLTHPRATRHPQTCAHQRPVSLVLWRVAGQCPSSTCMCEDGERLSAKSVSVA